MILSKYFNSISWPAVPLNICEENWKWRNALVQQRQELCSQERGEEENVYSIQNFTALVHFLFLNKFSKVPSFLPLSQGSLNT